MRLDERRIGEILHGIDSASMGPAFVSTAGRLLGHLGDVMTLGFTPMAPTGESPHAGAGCSSRLQWMAVDGLCWSDMGWAVACRDLSVPSGQLCRSGQLHHSSLLVASADPAAADQPPTQYLLQFESSDISRLRADVQSLGFVSLVT